MTRRGVKGGLLPSAYTSRCILSAILVFVSEVWFAQKRALVSIYASLLYVV